MEIQHNQTGEKKNHKNTIIHLAVKKQKKNENFLQQSIPSEDHGCICSPARSSFQGTPL